MSEAERPRDVNTAVVVAFIVGILCFFIKFMHAMAHYKARPLGNLTLSGVICLFLYCKCYYSIEKDLPLKITE